MTRRAITLIVPSAAGLPTVLTALALRVYTFTVEDDRGGSGGWLVSVPMLPLGTVRMVLEDIPPHLASVHAFAQEA